MDFNQIWLHEFRSVVHQIEVDSSSSSRATTTKAQHSLEALILKTSKERKDCMLQEQGRDQKSKKNQGLQKEDDRKILRSQYGPGRGLNKAESSTLIELILLEKLMQVMVKRQNLVDNNWMVDAWHFPTGHGYRGISSDICSGRQIMLCKTFEAALPLPCKNSSNPNQHCTDLDPGCLSPKSNFWLESICPQLRFWVRLNSFIHHLLQESLDYGLE